MRADSILLLATAFAGSVTAKAVTSGLQRPMFTNGDELAPNDFKIPTVHESAVMARRMLHLENIATLSTVFPSEGSSRMSDDGFTAFENKPSGLGGIPIGLTEYYADCEPDTGNPTVLAIAIATTFKNSDAGSNVTFSLRWHPTGITSRTPANLPRFALIGHLEDIPEPEAEELELKSCFAKTHPDATAWMPGNDIHESYWTRLIVDEVFWFGGFGDRSYIGWIPVEEWANVTKQEIDDCRLPGELPLSRQWL